MINQQILDYIAQVKAAGKTPDEIRMILLNAGWQAGDIDEALRADEAATQMPQGQRVPLKTGKFKASYLLVKQSWQIMKKDKEVVLFPILSSIALLIVLIPFIIYFFWYNNAHGENAPPPTQSEQMIEYAVAFIAYLLTYFIQSFFMAGLVTVVHARLNNGNLSFKDGFSNAWRHKEKIFAWSVINATLGIILCYIFEKVGLLGKILIKIMGVLWSVLAFFIVPVLILEELSMKESIKKSGSIFKKTWGETIIMNVSVNFFFAALLIAGIFPLIVLFVIGNGLFMVFGLIAYLIYVLVLMVISSTLNSIFKVALYEYANKGIVPQGFSPELIENAIRTKQK